MGWLVEVMLNLSFGAYVVSALYRVFLCMYVFMLYTCIYTNFIFSCRCYLCLVFYTNYLIIRHLNYSSVEMHAYFCNV